MKIEVQLPLEIQKTIHDIAKLRNSSIEEATEYVLNNYASRAKNLITNAHRSADRGIQKY